MAATRFPVQLQLLATAAWSIACGCARLGAKASRTGLGTLIYADNSNGQRGWEASYRSQRAVPNAAVAYQVRSARMATARRKQARIRRGIIDALIWVQSLTSAPTVNNCPASCTSRVYAFDPNLVNYAAGCASKMLVSAALASHHALSGAPAAL